MTLEGRNDSLIMSAKQLLKMSNLLGLRINAG